MFENIFKELEESQKELEISMEEMNTSKNEALSSIEENHKELLGAIYSLGKTMNNQLYNSSNKKLEYVKDDIDIILDETSDELDQLLASL